MGRGVSTDLPKKPMAHTYLPTPTFVMQYTIKNSVTQPSIFLPDRKLLKIMLQD